MIKGCLDNNRQAQERLYKSYYAAMMNICLRYSKSEDDAWDMLNTGFLKVFKSLHLFDEKKGTLGVWIKRIITNNAIDILRKLNYQNYTTILTPEAESLDLPEVFSRLACDDILALVRQLPAATQAVFNLHTVEGYSHIEIAKILGITDGTSRWHLHQAKNKLQELIKNIDAE